MSSPAHAFDQLIRTNRYLFHVHTDFTDGTNSVEDYCRFAERHGLAGVVFTEHVRVVSTYDFDEFVAEVIDARIRFPHLKVILGAEAKVLPSGVLDVPEHVLDKIEVLGVACHRFPYTSDVYVRAIRDVFSAYRSRVHTCVWLHPGSYFANHPGDNRELLEDMLDLALSHGFFIEYNRQYRLPPREVWSRVPDDRRVIGVNGHSVQGLERFFLGGDAEGSLKVP